MRKITTFLNRAVSIGTADIPIYDAALGVTKGINLLSLLILVLNVIFGPLYYFVTGKLDILIGSLSEAGFVAGLVILNYYKRRLLANILFYLVLNAATFYFSVILGQLGEAQLMIVFLVGLSLFMFHNFTTRLISISGTILLLVLMEVNFKFTLIAPVHASAHDTDLMRWTAYGVIIFLVAILFYLYALNNNRLLIELKKHSKIIESNLEREKSLNVIKSQFIRNSYHEVKTQFAGVFLIIQVLASMKKEDAVARLDDVVSNLRSGCQTLHLVLTNILEYSKFEAGISQRALYEPINMIMTIDLIVNIFKYAANEKNVDIECQYSEDFEEYVISDKVKVIQIVTNLLHNAIKFSKPNTCIHVTLDKQDGFYKLSIQDQGSGIARDILGKMFTEPFITEKSVNNEGGIGLGLHITREVVASLEGKIDVDSEIGKGATFTVSLPIVESARDARRNRGKYRESLI
jgi:signal transduction histidine kinase